MARAYNGCSFREWRDARLFWVLYVKPTFAENLVDNDVLVIVKSI